MLPRTLFLKVSRAILVSILHLMLIWLFFIGATNIVKVIALALALINMGWLLRMFTLSIQLSMAHRLKPSTRSDKHIIFNVLLGVVFNALLIYVFFVLVFYYISGLASDWIG